jgi:hypothetical protein
MHFFETPQPALAMLLIPVLEYQRKALNMALARKCLSCASYVGGVRWPMKSHSKGIKTVNRGALHHNLGLLI